MSDERYMRRALELAQMGIGSVSPNPMVGCVIVHEGKIIGEGYHRQFGESHAELNAVNSVKDQSQLAASTVYVTLEPCAHFGKTPPCADLLIKSKVKKVVICNHDPNPKVLGRGIARMREAGIDISDGVMKETGRLLNRRFFKSIESNRPFVILKWAQTSDGFIARKNFDSKWISNNYSRQLVHQWRAEEDAILVGTNTALHDNPKLNVRDWCGNDPMRVVIDRDLKLSNELNLFDQKVKTLCITESGKESKKNIEYIHLDKITPNAILESLHLRQIQSVIVEGGAGLLQSFINANLWDEARVFTSDISFMEGIASPILSGKLLTEDDIHGDRLKLILNS